jgi:hypothetical protein
MSTFHAVKHASYFGTFSHELEKCSSESVAHAAQSIKNNIPL